MNALFERQLARFGATTGPPPDWDAFVAAVSSEYDCADRDRQALEEDLRVAKKLEAVGQLASGIAHEINTPVQYVGDSMVFLRTAFEDLRSMIASWQTAREELRDIPGTAGLVERLIEAEELADLTYLVEQVPPAFERVADGIERVGSIVRAMKEFAHPDQRQMAPADLNRAIRNTLIVGHSEYKYCARIESDLQELPMVPCHLGELNQVLLNLIVNAAHAIMDARRGDEGRIRIASRVDGEQVVLSVSDNGTGIPFEAQDRIFEPFFTTKAVGRGTGQGLPIALSIIEKHGGTLTFLTDIGTGTTFEVRLPVGSAQES